MLYNIGLLSHSNTISKNVTTKRPNVTGAKKQSIERMVSMVPENFLIQANRACGTEISPRLFVISFVILYVCNIVQYQYLIFCHYVSSWQKEIWDARMQARESHCCCTSSASHNKITAGMLERKTGSRNGRRNGQMASEPLERAALFQWRQDWLPNTDL